MTHTELIHEVYQLLTRARLTLNNEKKLQREIKVLLSAHFGDRLESEKRLDPKNIIDFFLPGLGIEVKVKGNKKEIYKQCVRYCEFDEIQSLILVTGIMTGFPEEVNGKNCYILKLSQAWL